MPLVRAAVLLDLLDLWQYWYRRRANVKAFHIVLAQAGAGFSLRNAFGSIFLDLVGLHKVHTQFCCRVGQWSRRHLLRCTPIHARQPVASRNVNSTHLRFFAQLLLSCLGHARSHFPVCALRLQKYVLESLGPMLRQRQLIVLDLALAPLALLHLLQVVVRHVRRAPRRLFNLQKRRVAVSSGLLALVDFLHD